MGSSLIITKELLEKSGRKLMLEFYEHIQDEHFLKKDEFKSQRKFYDENIIKKYERFNLNQNKHLYKYENDNIITISTDSLSNLIKYKVIDGKYCLLFHDKIVKKLEKKDLLTYIEDKIKNKTIEVEFIFDFLIDMDKQLNLDKSLEFECSEDLFCLKSAFLKAYDLFHYSGHELIA